LVATWALAACTTTFAKDAVQPNPLLHPADTLRSSEVITIITGDMDLSAPEPATGYSSSSIARYHRYPLRNEASFTMVSRDRMRFHVQIDHKWDEYADLKTWEVSLTDDQGHHWAPEAVEHVRRRVITRMWDRERQRAICAQSGASGRDGKGDCLDTIGHDESSGYLDRQTLGTISVFRGNADFVFYDRDMFRPNLKWLTLRVHRSGEAFEFTWHFEDEVAAQ
jgi:hypothetical protein